MRCWEIFRFEIAYQSRRVSTWLYFAVLVTLTYYVSRQIYIDNARRDGYFFNAPFVIAVMTFLGSMMGLLSATQLAGDAAARDVQTRMDPLFYTTPVGKTAYLRGRFLAAFILYAVILLAVPLGLLLAAVVPGPEAELIGPFRPAAYLGAYLSLALPNAFVATAFLFSIAVLSRRAMASYLGGLLLFSVVAFSRGFVAGTLEWWELAKLLDPFGMTVLGELSRGWTPVEKSTRLIGLQGSLLSNRILWIGIALGVLALTQLRFRMAHHTAGARRMDKTLSGGPLPHGRVPVPSRAGKQATFGFATHARQMLAVARESFQEIAMSWGGLVLAGIAALAAVSATQIEHMGVPLFATAERITAFLAAPLTSPQEFFGMMVPLFILIHAGELVWREREARLSEIIGAAPIPEWVCFLGKFVGLGLVLGALQAVMTAAGILVQVFLGHFDFEIGLYARILFGLQLPDYLLFALLALVVHVVVNHKYAGHLVVVIAYAFMAFGPALGVGHNLLVYGSDPGWSYSDIRGFEPFIAPWLWFKFYWAAWALLLAVAATLLWVSGRDADLGSRLALARRRFTRRAAGLATAAVALILTLGSFLFYNTNVLNQYRTASDGLAWRAEYERRYGQYKGIRQPELTGANLRVEIYPDRREAEIRGTFHLVNTGPDAIDSVHLAIKPAVHTMAVRFDRPVRNVLSDEEFGHRIYALETSLQPGELLQLHFEVHFKPRGFSNRGMDASVVANGTYFTNDAWLPAIGYQADRELRSAGDRRKYRLSARPETPLLDDVEARHGAGWAARIAFEAVVGTGEGQVAVAPGRLRRSWTLGRRRYFHYATDVPIRNHYAFFSAAYAVHEARWNDTSIEIFHHPAHAWNVDRMVRSVQASLDYYTQQFGPYPHGQLRFVEQPGDGVSLHASPVNISYEEGFSLLNPGADQRDIDLPFAVVAHEVAHQWWGATLTPAPVEGAAVLTESLAWYSGMQVVERTLGREHLRRLVGMMWQVYATPRTRAAVPLLRASDSFLAYRKGPFAMYALREYAGVGQVNAALRRLIERHGSGTPPLATTQDLYRELKAAIPQPLHYLLADLFEANTFWELATQRVSAKQTGTGAWQVTLDVRARKVVVDTAGVETEVPMDDLIEVGVFAEGKSGEPGEPLYLQMHRLRSGEHRITVMVASEPARAGIDPRNLLIDVEGDDNVREITRSGGQTR
ncbi:MAG: ABC transporter permease [Acidobacteria bacterium]|nr:ABC transporter permease [Acidobacteriota bacterium]